MNLRLTRRRLGSLAAVSILAGCAVPPAQQDQASSDALRTKDAAFIAPQGYGSALAALPASGTAKDNSLANADAIDENSPDIHSFHETGRASWYGRAFHGRRTASGERFNMKALTAAHRTLPLGSYVRVSVPGTSKWVVVKINDRGPYARGRVLDLSYAAAKILGVQHAGTAKVNIEGLSRQEAKVAQADMVAANSNIDH
ncbi:septal ring lytic transglycosylase RlpA family protein [Paraburkholderia guartelaensis]|uniref:septal ring lytic transglycosylase RlpA family protein n=1 Tax=Paraburkholderia guartelaensis TaxID=2546446 RepID=UPI002AB651B7|nr:septal ring lytic transglycosylase RlpA family protein [Paraburkholderia guartelaensis]